MTTETLVQVWPNVLEAVKAKGRVAAIVIGNASLVSLDEAVLTLRFPRQGDVKGFVNSKYEDLLKQVINTMFGINVVVRAVTGGGDMPAARRPGPGPAPVPPAQPAGMGGSGLPSPPAPSEPAQPSLTRPSSPEPAGPSGAYPPEPSGPAGGSAGGAGSATGPFGSSGFPMGDLPPLPPPPSPDDEDFDPDDEDMSVSVPNELTGMALVQRELGGQVIAEYDE